MRKLMNVMLFLLLGIITLSMQTNEVEAYYGGRNKTVTVNNLYDTYIDNYSNMTGFDINTVGETIDSVAWNDGTTDYTYRDIFGDSLHGTGKNNLIDNGDFSNGTTDWGTFYGINTASNNILTNTADGSNPYSWVFQNGILTTGDILYFNSYIRVTNSSAIDLKYWSGTGFTDIVNNPTANTWYNVSDLFTVTADSFFLFQHRYVDSATANGKVMGIKENFVLNITDIFGATYPTVNEMDTLLEEAKVLYELEFSDFGSVDSNTQLLTLDYGRDYNDVVQNASNWGTVDYKPNNILYYYNGSLNLGIKNPIDSYTLPNILLEVGDTIFTTETQDYVDNTDIGNVVTLDTLNTDRLVVRVDRVSFPNSASWVSYLQSNNVEFLYEYDTPVVSTDKYYLNESERVFINLTDDFGAGEEPTDSEMNNYITEFPSYWTSHTFNYVSSGLDTVLLNSIYEVDNLVDINGDLTEALTDDNKYYIRYEDGTSEVVYGDPLNDLAWNSYSYGDIFGDSLYGTGKNNLVSTYDNWSIFGAITNSVITSDVAHIILTDGTYYDAINTTLNTVSSGDYLYHSTDLEIITAISDVTERYFYFREDSNYRTFDSDIDETLLNEIQNISGIRETIFTSELNVHIGRLANDTGEYKVTNTFVLNLTDIFGATYPTVEEMDQLLVDYKTLYPSPKETVINLTSYYGGGNEPTVSEFEAVNTTVSTYSISYTYTDLAYYTVEQNSPLYQYENNDDTGVAKFKLVLEQSIAGLQEEINPIYYIDKYDLDMNYIGNITDGDIFVTTDVDGDNKLEYSLEFNLPSTTAIEEGYIYMVFDSDSNGTFMGGGYVYKEITGSVRTGGIFNFNDDDTYITVGSSAYLSISNPNQFEDDDFQEYVITNSNNRFVLHAEYDSTLTDVNMIFYSENTSQVVNRNALLIYELYCQDNEWGISDTRSSLLMEFTVDGTLPLLLKYADDNLVDNYITSFDNWIYDYNDYLFSTFFDNVGYGNNEGVYSYKLNDGIQGDLAIGHTPLFYINDFTSLNLPRHLAREGDPFYLDLNLDDEGLLKEVYDYQYIRDTNTLIINENIDFNTVTVQSILIDIYQGIGTDLGVLQYHFKNTSGNYKNGAGFGSYDIYLYDSYDLKTPTSINDTVDNFLDDLNINDTFGKLLIGFVLSLTVAIIGYLRSKNFVITILLFFFGIGISFLLGFIPAWIILFIVLIIALIVWYSFNRSKI